MEAPTAKPPSVIWLILLWFLVYIAPIGVLPLWNPLETFPAQTAQEMLRHGYKFTAYFNGVPLEFVRAVPHWPIMLSLRMFGHTPFAARLPSAVLTGVIASMLYLWTRRFISGHAAWASAAIYLTSAGVFACGVHVSANPTVTAVLTGTLLMLFILLTNGVGREARFILSAVTALLVSGSVVTAGALSVPYLSGTILSWLFLRKLQQTKSLRARWILGLAPAAIIPAAWGIVSSPCPIIWMHTAETLLRSFFDTAMLPPFVLVAALLPWAGLLAVAIWRLVLRYGNNDRTLIYVAALTTGASGAVSDPARFLTWIALALPWGSLLSTEALGNLDHDARTGFKPGLALWLVVLTTVLIFGIQHRAFIQKELYSNEENWRLLILAVGVALGMLSTAFALACRSRKQTFQLMVVSPLFLIACYPLYVPDRFVAIGTPSSLLSQFAERVPDDALIVTEFSLLPAVCWHYNRDDIKILQPEDGTEVQAVPELFRTQALLPEEFFELIREHYKEKPTALVLRKQTYELWKHNLPVPGFTVADQYHILATFQSAPRRHRLEP